MKFLKGQNLSRYSPVDNALAINSYGRAVMDINGGLMIPKGTTAQRPYLTADVRHGANGEVDTSKIPNGYMRFNTDTEEFEGYINGRWETIRAPGASTVSIETFGPGDGTETVFGALANVPASQNNLLVFVENVFQIPGENFEMVQNPAGKPAGYYLEFYTAVPFSKTVTVFFGFAN